MTKEQHEELIREVTNTVRVVVNGKIDSLDKKIDTYVSGDLKWKETVDTFMGELMPIKEGMRALQYINKFFKWVGFPAVGVTVFYWMFK